MYASYLEFKLIGYIDSDFGGNIDDRKRTFRHVFNFRSGAITWGSKK